MNDPNGLCFWQGRWHLFYQANPAAANPANWNQGHWGHAVSDDLMHWRDLPYAIRPDPEKSCFSCSILVEPDRAIAAYYGLQIGTMVAVASDPLLLAWKKVGNKPVIPCSAVRETNLGPEQPPGWNGNPAPGNAINLIYVPCIWKKGDSYYLLSGGALLHAASGRRVRTPFLFRSPDLASWEYLHPFTKGDIFGLPGDDFTVPYFWPIGNRHILLHASHASGAMNDGMKARQVDGRKARRLGYRYPVCRRVSSSPTLRSRSLLPRVVA